MRVIIIDDSKIIRESLVRLLSVLEGIKEIEQIDNLKSAYDWIKLNQSSIQKINTVVLLDIGLPEGSGIDLIKKFKRLNHPPIVVMLTNNSAQQYRVVSLSAGADYFFDKTDEFNEAIELIENLSKQP